MKNHILICGLNGSGKSTFGKALAKEINAAFKDIEDYYFPNRRAVDAYTDPRSKTVAILLFFCYHIKKDYDRRKANGLWSD